MFSSIGNSLYKNSVQECILSIKVSSYIPHSEILYTSHSFIYFHFHLFLSPVYMYFLFYNLMYCVWGHTSSQIGVTPNQFLSLSFIIRRYDKYARNLKQSLQITDRGFPTVTPYDSLQTVRRRAHLSLRSRSSFSLIKLTAHLSLRVVRDGSGL